MALAFNTMGTASIVAGNPTPAYPTVASGDLLLLWIQAKPASGTQIQPTFSPPAGWTLVGSRFGGIAVNTAVDTGKVYLEVYSKVATGSESGSITVTVTNGDVAAAWISRITSATGAYSLAISDGEDTSAGASWSATAATDPGFITGDIAIATLGMPTDNPTNAWTGEAYNIPGCTWTFAGFTGTIDTLTGTDMFGRCIVVNVTSGTSTGAPSHTGTVSGTTTNAQGPELFLRVREATSGVTGSAALTGESSLSATGTVVKLGSSSLTAESALIVSGGLLWLGSSSLTGQSSLTATGAIVQSGTSSLTVQSSLTASGVVSKIGSSVLSSQSSLSASGVVTLAGSAALSGQSSLSVIGIATVFGSSPFTSQSSFAASVLLTRLGSAALTAQSNLSVTSAVTALASASLTVQTSLTAVGTTPSPSANLAVQSSLVATGLVTRIGSVALTAQSNVTSSGYIKTFGVVTLTGQSTATVTGYVKMFGDASLNIQSNIAVTGSLFLLGTALLTVQSNMTADGVVRPAWDYLYFEPDSSGSLTEISGSNFIIQVESIPGVTFIEGA